MVINSASSTKPYIYMGYGKAPKNVTHVIVHESVTAIPKGAFRERHNLKEVVLPEGLIEIGGGGFYGCESLKDISFPFALRVIGKFAFVNCIALARVDFNEGLLTIGVAAFNNCRSILHIQIPSTVTTIGNSAFYGCSVLKDVQLCEGLQMIEPQAFYQCSSLMSINIPSTVTTIGVDAFASCSALKDVQLCEGLEMIEPLTFCKCYSLLAINIPSSVITIGVRAFESCSALKEVQLGERLLMIDPWAFSSCHSLLGINIPSSVIKIGFKAFECCSALKDIQLGEGLLMIDPWAFSSCHSLLGINIPSTVATIGSNAFVHCNFLRNVAIAPDSTLGQQELQKSHLINNLHEVHCSVDLVKGRFDGLPLHRTCFYQTESATLLEEVKMYATKENLAQLDCLGMTPLHIVSCSGRHDVRLYKFFVDEYPEALPIKDKWGETPLVYAILGEAPHEIVHFLFEEHSKILNGILQFGFLEMAEKLGKKKGTSAEFMRSIIQAQRTHFPTLEIEWERIVNENVEGKMHVKVFFVLVEASISKRLNCMSSEHQITIKNVINEVNAIWKEMETVDGQRIINCIRDYAMLYREFLKEATTLLELALWKFAINELENDQESNEGGNPCGNGAVIVHSESRRQCRFKCNTEDIFPIILSFL